jgi:hypothetical protein
MVVYSNLTLLADVSVRELSQLVHLLIYSASLFSFGEIIISISQFCHKYKKAAINKAQTDGASRPSKIICNAPRTFCSIYQSTYEKEFQTMLHTTLVMLQVNNMQTMFYQVNNMPSTKTSGHSKAWKTGYSQGYADSIMGVTGAI